MELKEFMEGVAKDALFFGHDVKWSQDGDSLKVELMMDGSDSIKYEIVDATNLVAEVSADPDFEDVNDSFWSVLNEKYKVQ